MSSYLCFTIFLLSVLYHISGILAIFCYTYVIHVIVIHIFVIFIIFNLFVSIILFIHFVVIHMLYTLSLYIVYQFIVKTGGLLLAGFNHFFLFLAAIVPFCIYNMSPSIFRFCAYNLHRINLHRKLLLFLT